MLPKNSSSEMPTDQVFTLALRDYVQPVKDEGFTDRVLRAANADAGLSEWSRPPERASGRTLCLSLAIGAAAGGVCLQLLRLLPANLETANSGSVFPDISVLSQNLTVTVAGLAVLACTSLILFDGGG